MKTLGITICQPGNGAVAAFRARSAMLLQPNGIGSWQALRDGDGGICARAGIARETSCTVQSSCITVVA